MKIKFKKNTSETNISMGQYLAAQAYACFGYMS